MKDDIFLCPVIDIESGLQWVELHKIDIKTGKIEFKDYIRCIHVALAKISPKELEKLQNDEDYYFDFYKKHHTAFSSEILEEVNLSIEEKFFVLRSWVEGIVELGLDALNIQNEIDDLVIFAYPMSFSIFKFLIKAKPELILEYISKIERNCVFEGIYHESSLLANLNPLLEIIYDNYQSNKHHLSEQDIDILKEIDAIKPPPKLFFQDDRFVLLKSEFDPNFAENSIRDFNKLFVDNPHYKKSDLITYLTSYCKVIGRRYRQNRWDFKGKDREIFSQFLKIMNLEVLIPKGEKFWELFSAYIFDEKKGINISKY